MQCVIYEKKMLKMFVFVVTMVTKVGGVAKYENPIFRHFCFSVAIFSAYIETNTVNDTCKF